MANKNSKSPGNVDGSYYVDTNCIGCGQCVYTASEFFTEGANGSVYVKTQPGSQKDTELCKEALSNCPVGAIGDDG